MFRNLMCSLSFAALAVAQESPDTATRQIWDATLLATRPSPLAQAPKKGTTKAVPAVAKLPASSVKGTLVGVTVWSFRPSNPNDTREIRALIHDEGGDEDLTPERVAADQPLAEGQRLRIGIEVSKPGYLYVIDRDVYADGTKSAPFLIFPSTTIMGGNNSVRAGMLIEIPAASDKLPYFRMKRTRPNQTKEVLTILISPTPIPSLKVGGRQQLDEMQLAAWEKQWRVKSYQLGDAKVQGQTYTLAEKQAASGGKPLGKDDPLPQMMYQLDTKAGAAGMMDVPLRIAK